MSGTATASVPGVASGSPAPPTRLAALLDRFGWGYHRFAAEFARASRAAGEELTISPRQFKNWRNGRVRTAPREGRAVILETLFPPWSAAELLSPPRPAGPLLENPPPGSKPTDLPAAVPLSPQSGTGDIGDGLDADADAAVRFARQLRGTDVHPLVLDQLDADVAQIARRYVAQPLAEVVGELRALRAAAMDLLEGRQYPRQAVRLHLATARLCGLACHAAMDAGRYRAAADLGRVAEMCAQLGGDPLVLGWVRSAQSLVAYWQGQGAAAADLAALGREAVMRPASRNSTAPVRLAALEARARSRLGDHAGALSALAVANDARQKCGDGWSDPDGDGGMFAFPAAKQHAYAGATLLALGGDRNLRRAADASANAIADYLAAAPADRSTGDLLAAHVDLATARLGLGELDGAADAVAYVLTVPAGRCSASIRQRLAALGRGLTAPRYLSAGLGRDLREGIAPYIVRPGSMAVT